MKNNIRLSIYIPIVLSIVSLYFIDFWVWGMIFGIFYAQVIEWFVHGWIQHSRFKIFKKYRDMHVYHHKYPTKPLSVQPIQYFIIGSIPLLFPFYEVQGFIFGYLIAYSFINIIHNDLHSEYKMMPRWIWKNFYFNFIKESHDAHHSGLKLSHTTHSVTNPYLDIIFCKIGITKINDWIAKRLKI